MSSPESPDKGAESAADAPMERFRSLAKKLIEVPRAAVEEAEREAKKTARVAPRGPPVKPG